MPKSAHLPRTARPLDSTVVHVPNPRHLLEEEAEEVEQASSNGSHAPKKFNPALEASKAASSVLTSESPQKEEVITVGDRTYIIQELPVDAFIQLSGIITEEIEALGEKGLLDQKEWEGVNLKDTAIVMKKLAQVWQRVPNLAGKLLALMLSGEEPDDPVYIRRNLKPRQLIQVVRAFMRLNPWGDLIEDFFALR